ncbi:aminoglycoside phosphotransferase family protein [Paenibacillus sp. FSL W8-0426]|uniref:aminoglycoside phosphotransferase family protein n=1 Tax=Paenibacillus sp. FSL W8-0426 TaxID=2921714 RepID=UPI0030DC429C
MHGSGVCALKDIHWIELHQDIRALMNQPCHVVPLSPGMEADVYRYGFEGRSCVLKIWNKESRPNIANQYRLLSELHHQGVKVSIPYGWGEDAERNQVLLMNDAGIPVDTLTSEKLKDLALMLMEVHRFRKSPQDDDFIPAYDFAGYFFPGIASHPDLERILSDALQRVSLRQDCLIHGDYNLWNVLEANGCCTIIDWTNGQWGDPRYDVAWSVFLMDVYTGPKYGKTYRVEFLQWNDYASEDMIWFEALACLRWLLLKRTGGVPLHGETLQRMTAILHRNPYVSTDLLLR